MAFDKNYAGGNVGGNAGASSTLTTAGSSNQTSVEPGAGNKTAIVELYLIPGNTYSAIGLKNSSDQMNPSTSNNYSEYSWTRYNGSGQKSYDFGMKFGGLAIYVSTNTSSSLESPRRQVFALHSGTSDVSIYPAHLLYGPKIQTSTFNSEAYIGYSFGQMNTWLSHTSADGKKYMSITVNANNKFIGTSISVEKGKKYTFKMHTVSKKNYDGIIISTSSMTSGSVQTSGVARCSGPDEKAEYTYVAKSNGTIYIYFRTDGSTLTDSSTNFTTGDIEITEELITTTVTLNRNGATSGDTSFNIKYGTNVSTISVTKPTGKAYCNFEGYYTGSSRTSSGTKYIGSSGTGVSGKTWDIAEETYTLYAFYNYTKSIVECWYPLHCVYCTSSAAAASTLQAAASITLGTMRQPLISGSITSYSQLNVNAANHLGNLTMPDDETVTIPRGKASGDYKFEIKYTFTPDDTSVFPKEETKKCDIWIIPTYIVDETMTLSDISSNLTQKKDIPAGSFTLNVNNLSEYFQYPSTIPNTTQVIYNNGKTVSSTPQITWSINKSITFDSLGSTITSRKQVAIPNNSNISMKVPRHTYNGDIYSTSSTVIQIVSNELGSSNVDYHSRFEDLGIRTTQMENIVMDLESEFGITIDEFELNEVYSVDLLCKYLYKFHNVGSVSSNQTNSYFINASYNSTKVYREANTVTDLHISVSDNPIYVDDTATLNTTADFTSGSEGVSVNGLETFSGYDTSIIQIDNT